MSHRHKKSCGEECLEGENAGQAQEELWGGMPGGRKCRIGTRRVEGRNAWREKEENRPKNPRIQECLKGENAVQAQEELWGGMPTGGKRRIDQRSQEFRNAWEEKAPDRHKKSCGEECLEGENAVQAQEELRGEMPGGRKCRTGTRRVEGRNAWEGENAVQAQEELWGGMPGGGKRRIDQRIQEFRNAWEEKTPDRHKKSCGEECLQGENAGQAQEELRGGMPGGRKCQAGTRRVVERNAYRGKEENRPKNPRIQECLQGKNVPQAQEISPPLTSPH